MHRGLEKQGEATGRRGERRVGVPRQGGDREPGTLQGSGVDKTFNSPIVQIALGIRVSESGNVWGLRVRRHTGPGRAHENFL